MQKIALSEHFEQLYELIINARSRALIKVNHEQLNLYWQVGAYIHVKLSEGSWGDKVVEEFETWLKQKDPSIKNFDRRNIYRMQKFYLSYFNISFNKHQKGFEIVGSAKPQFQNTENEDVKIVGSLNPQLNEMPFWLSKIPWTHHIQILSAAKDTDERIFYLLLTDQEKYTVKELKRQLKSGLYERQMLSSKQLVTFDHPKANKIYDVFRNNYVFEFLDLQEPFNEIDLKKALLSKLKKFILELGRDFIFIGEEYRLIVGTKDFNIDLLFYHRDLQCMVMFELKTVAFEPEHLGKLNFYLEALDRDVKKPHENPSIGVLLCKTKNNTEVEYALSRNISPALVAEYQTKLIDKGVLKRLLSEWTDSFNESDPLDKNKI
jgi:predicted nuclease of restriction endonuclease-like (RecB) superfamily